jgi:glycosyltransferase involved in cell wall biosynthesis
LPAPQLSVFLPAYNEEENVRQAVLSVSRVLEHSGLTHEIIVVNDGSRDRTGDIVRALASSVDGLRLAEHYPNRGYGGALQAGFAASRGELIAFVPADNQFEFSEIYLLLKAIEEADIVSGWRAARQDHTVRLVFAFGWNTLVRILFGQLCRDIDCGFKLVRRQVIEQVPLHSNGAMIDTELLAGARARGFRIAEVPVTHLAREGGRATGADPRVIVRAFRDLVRYRIRLWREMGAEHRRSGGRTLEDR